MAGILDTLFSFGYQGPKLYAIGDIHGCAYELEQLLKKLTIKKDTKIVFLGDYVDRGPNSRKVIDIILDLQKKCQVVTLMGNHESMFLDFLEKPESMGAGIFILNGGAQTLANYTLVDGSFEIPDEHIQFLKNLKLTYQTKNYFFVHAGVPVTKELEAIDEKEDRETLMWTRGPFLTSQKKWTKRVIHGHSPKPNPEHLANRVNCDTGCAYGGRLTAFDVYSDKFISVLRDPSKSKFSTQLSRTVDGRRLAVRFNGKMEVRAGRAGEARHVFETINYNEHGLLLKQLDSPENPHFVNGHRIEGFIGKNQAQLIEFEGDVVRVENRAGVILFGIKLTRMINGDNENEGFNSNKK